MMLLWKEEEEESEKKVVEMVEFVTSCRWRSSLLRCPTATTRRHSISSLRIASRQELKNPFSLGELQQRKKENRERM